MAACEPGRAVGAAGTGSVAQSGAECVVQILDVPVPQMVDQLVFETMLPVVAEQMVEVFVFGALHTGTGPASHVPLGHGLIIRWHR